MCPPFAGRASELGVFLPHKHLMGRNTTPFPTDKKNDSEGVFLCKP